MPEPTRSAGDDRHGAQHDARRNASHLDARRPDAAHPDVRPEKTSPGAALPAELTSRPVNRRAFLATAAAGGALAAAGPLVRVADAAEPRKRAGAGGAGVVPDWRIPQQRLEDIGIAEVLAALESGAMTSRSLVEGYLERIEALDGQGPTLKAVIELNPDARELADELDAERAAGRLRGPLHGVPVMVKDNIDSGDRMLTTAGSLALVGAPAARDAFVLARLRAAGALLLGKTNLSEWANFRSTRSSSGWSGRGGQCRNPYVLDRSPCGSSSGSGAAVAASLCAGAVGTETDGSVTCPAGINGLVGIKPTVGLVSRTGIVPISHSQDTAGPMTRSVRDAALMLTAMAGVDPADAATADARGNIQDYTTFLDAGALSGARLGILRQRHMGYSPDSDALAERAFDALRAVGAVLVDDLGLPDEGEVGDHEWQVLLYEFKHDLNAYFATRSGVPVRTLEEAIAFNSAHADTEMPWFGQEIFEMAQEKGPLTEQEYIDHAEAAKRMAGPEGIDALMDEHSLDALICPTDAPSWTIDLVNGDHFIGGSSRPAAVAGYPHITVPMGYAHGLPVGLSFMGRKWGEGRLIGYAYAYEQATMLRRPPSFRPTLPYEG